MKNTLHMQKGTFPAEATSNSERIKRIALAIVNLHQSDDISQAVS